MKLYPQIVKGIEEFQSSGKSLIEYLTSLQDNVKSLRRAYRTSPVNVNYKSESIQSAYLLAYFPHYYQLIYKILCETKIHAFANKTELTITFIGGGPGSEAYGAIKFISDHLPEVKKVSVHILDLNATSWNYSHKIVLSHLIEHQLRSGLRVEWNTDFLDLTNLGSVQNNLGIFKHSDFVTVQNCINEVGRTQYSVLEESVLLVCQSLPRPSNLLLIDLTSSVRSTLHTLEKKITETLQLGKPIGTLSNDSPSAMISLNASPSHDVRKYVLTGADGLIPRKNLRYDYSLIFKGSIDDNKHKREDPHGFSSLYGPMSGEVLAAISGFEEQVYIGVDFGTSVSVASIAYLQEGELRIEALELSQKDHNGYEDTSPLLPSVIAVFKNQYMVGKHAEQNLARLEIGKDAFSLFKEDLGFLEETKYPHSLLKNHPVKTIRNSKDALIDYLGYFRLAIQSSLLVKGISGKPVFSWSVPTDYPYAKKKQLINCAEQAGFAMENSSIIEEPISALINYVFENNSTLLQAGQNVFVVDLGAGTFDISIFEISRDSDNINSKLLAAKRLKEIGGNLINELMAKRVSSDYPKRTQLRYYCERLKRKICTSINTDNSVGYALPGIVDSTIKVSVPMNSHSEKLSMRYCDFTEIMNDYWKGNNGTNLEKTIESGLHEAGIQKEDINLLILTGGGLRNPYIQNFLNAYFPNAELELTDNIQEQVSRGNALQSLAHHVFGKSIVNPVLHHNFERLISVSQKEVLFSKGENCPTETIDIDLNNQSSVKLIYGVEEYSFEWNRSDAKQLSLFIDQNLIINAELITHKEIVTINPKTTKL